jgi:hypothetical protein
MALSRPVKVFISYTHKDEELRKKLEAHLAILRHQGLIEIWHDRQIGAGTDWAGSIHNKLDTADLILLLVSADFIESAYCFGVELRRAMERHEAGTARVIPIILRDCLWRKALFAKLQALPTNGEAVESERWRFDNEAFRDIAEGIELAAEELLSKVSSDVVGQNNSTTAQLGGSIPQIAEEDTKQPTEEETNSPGWDTSGEGDYNDRTPFGHSRGDRKPAKN